MHFAVGDLFKTAGFWSAFCAWLVASVLKMAVNLHRTRRIDFQYLVSLGGMPSAHSAMVSGLATSLGITEGFDSPMFVLALAFAFVVMFDASTVRRATGQQARLLNQIVDDLFRQHHLPENKLRELLGHTRTEVFVGMLVGITVATAVNLLAG